MRNTRRRRAFVASLAALSLVLGACGGAEDAAPEEEAPLALDLEQPEAPAPEEEAPAEEPDEFDLAAAVDVYVSTIPAGFMTAGDVDALKEALAVPGTVLIDVREAAEVEDGVIPGAVNIPIREIPDNLDAIPTDRPVVVYCASGWRAGMTVSALRMMGYDNVVAFTPSFSGWTAAGGADPGARRRRGRLPRHAAGRLPDQLPRRGPGRDRRRRGARRRPRARRVRGRLHRGRRLHPDPAARRPA